MKLALVMLAAVACGSSGGGASSSAGSSAKVANGSAATTVATASAPPDARPGNGKPVVAKPSTRCAECHGKMAEEWRGSVHAQSGRSKLYQALAAAAPDGGAICAGCHTPLVPLAGGDLPAAKEGVTCDVCHTIKDVAIDQPPPRFELAVFDMVKYGPLCDAKDHYFHRMGCSKLHEKAELCGGCHLRVADGVPLYTTYQEWKESTYRDEGWQCQDCHMPGVKAPVAEGEKPREGVPDHGFFGGGDLRKDAVKLDLTSRELDGGVMIDAVIANYAGHDLPTGFPGKRAVLRAVAYDRAGKEVARDEITYGRRLVDARGAPTAYAGAVRVASDDRLKPKEIRTVMLFGGRPLGEVGRVKADFVWQSIDPALAAPLGVPVEEKPITKTELKIR
jgi:hypothetical protein